MNEKIDPVDVTRATYEQIAAVYAEKYFDYYKHNLEQLKRFTALLPTNARVLDAGSGPGGVSEFLRDRGFQVVGVDNSPAMVALARERVHDVDFVEGDMRELALEDESFDGILADYSLIHIPKKDLPKVLAEFNRVLKQAGVVYISMYEGRKEGYIDETFKPGKQTFWNFIQEEEFCNLSLEAGIEIVNVERKTSDTDEDFLADEFFFIARKI